jgi:hypothetical protein
MIAGRDVGAPGYEHSSRRRPRHAEPGALVEPRASSSVNTGGMCCTTTTGTGSSGQRRADSSASALGPPVEVPIDHGTAGFGRRVEDLRGGPSPVPRRPGDGGRLGRTVVTATVRSGPASGEDLRDELARAPPPAPPGDAADVRRLGHVVGGAERERLEGRRCAALGERAEHDHGQPWVRPADLAQRRDAVHLGHLDVEGDQVGVELVDPSRGRAGRWRRCRRPRCRVGFQHVVTRRRTTTESSTTSTRIGTVVTRPRQTPSSASFSEPRCRAASSRTRRRPAIERAATSMCESDSEVTIITRPSAKRSARTRRTNSSPSISGMFQSTSARRVALDRRDLLADLLGGRRSAWRAP